MKKTFLILILSGAFLATKAQQIKYGVKAGVNLANVAGDVEGNKMKIGFNAGAFAKVSLTEAISLQPELLLSTQGAKEKGSFEGINYEVKNNVTYLNIPVLAQYNTASGFYGETGPQFGFLLSAKAKSDEGKQDIKDGLKKFDLSWAFGVGYLTQSNVGVNVRYNLGLSNMSDAKGMDNDAKMRNSVFQIGVFYVLGSK
jgi:hypothetical protein